MVKVNRKRYVVFHTISPSGIGKGLIIKLIRDRTRDLDPDHFERVKPWVVYFHNGWGIVRTSHKGIDDMISLMNSLKGIVLKDGVMDLHVVGVSGTLRRAFLKQIPEKAREGKHYRVRRKQ